ncbi:MAG: L,D-transpeptidase family protein [Lachnospiraceae bacterium]|nr:L,D-transpeptidase family protein [Lachnospiraceae bacterium]
MNQSQNRAGSKGRTGRKKPFAKKPAAKKAADRSFMGGNRKTARTGSSARTGRGGRTGKASGSRSVLKLIVGFLIVAAFIAVTGYIVYADRYESHFIEGTVINNNDVGGLDLEEAENLLANSSDYKIEIDFRDGSSEWISGDSISLGYEYGDGVAQMLASQDKYHWIEGVLGETRSYTIDNGVHFDEEQLAAIVNSFPEFSEDVQVAPVDARCVRTAENAFAIEPESEGNWIESSRAFACISEAIGQQKRLLNLSTAGAYESPAVTADDPELNERVAQLNRFLETTVTYDLPDGGQWTVGRDTLIEWVSAGVGSENSGADITEDGDSGTDGWEMGNSETGGSGMDYYIDAQAISSKCAEAISSLASIVDDIHTSRTFYATSGRTVEIASDTFGRQIDQAAEVEQLAANLLNFESAEREPAYLMNTYPESLNGGDYIEVDLRNQMVYLYKDGGLFYDTPCVSGLADDPERVTITGLFKIQEKDRDRTLKGKPDENGVPTYESFVSYWMGFSGAYGLHDATWRDEFGGDIFEYAGSHGCVNLPYSAAETIYNYVEEGTRVIVF